MILAFSGNRRSGAALGAGGIITGPVPRCVSLPPAPSGGAARLSHPRDPARLSRSAPGCSTPHQIRGGVRLNQLTAPSQPGRRLFARLWRECHSPGRLPGQAAVAAVTGGP
jgi:hypothetical protein